ncbi:hypothetical protein [Lutibacter sp. B1]|uniref:hypothetical protein n=1 Tax=Lutibacter sp. B1 TaxID=2725996 RepID=UPI0014578EAD|nr:hypothetical protein [Lutibacter sp. B1]NLP56647.1 hypothetical protein [Lutibacter sp. B1]
MKNIRKSSLWIGSFITLAIIFIPYLLYIHQRISAEATNIETIFGNFEGGIYIKVQTYVYFLFSKLVPLLLLVIWFLTNKHWWVHAIIIPISVYLFQLISVINDSVKYVDEIEFIYSVPLTIIVMVVLYFIRSKIAVYIQAVDLKKEMDETMNHPKPEE